jgi:predicted GNAT family N-acyltransferase
VNARIVLGDWAAQREPAQRIRYEVFVVEQNVPIELEWDEMDALCVHAIAYDEQGDAVGTGRLLPDGHIGRMAVRSTQRGAGVGSALLQALMQQARQRGDKAVVLNAQTRAEEFYARHGFVREGELFMEAGIPHVRMRHVFRAGGGST